MTWQKSSGTPTYRDCRVRGIWRPLNKGQSEDGLQSSSQWQYKMSPNQRTDHPSGWEPHLEDRLKFKKRRTKEECSIHHLSIVSVRLEILIINLLLELAFAWIYLNKVCVVLDGTTRGRRRTRVWRGGKRRSIPFLLLFFRLLTVAYLLHAYRSAAALKHKDGVRITPLVTQLLFPLTLPSIVHAHIAPCAYFALR